MLFELSLSSHLTSTNMEYRKLNRAEESVILYRRTEPPFSGEFENHFQKGTYHCKRCGAPLFQSDSKFDASCGWPSFDDSIPGSVKEIPDPDGYRTEIRCSSCDGHLGHVFRGEHFTQKNLRHCVNSISLTFDPEDE